MFSHTTPRNNPRGGQQHRLPFTLNSGFVMMCILGLLAFNLACFLLDMWMLQTLERSHLLLSLHQSSDMMVLDSPERRKSRHATTAKTIRSPSHLASETSHEGDDQEELSALDYVQEMPVIKPSPVYIMVPSVRRKNDEDYLLQVLDSFGSFPLNRVYVFNNARPGQEHKRWEQARAAYPKVHFLRNQAPLPDEHPAAANSSAPLPDFVQYVVDTYNETWAVAAHKDNDDRREWRRKECFDFTTMARYMMTNVVEYDNDEAPLNKTWVIFNQDDAKWKKPFGVVKDALDSATKPRVDIHPNGLVSVGFRADKLGELVDHALQWCDFLPVDWMVWSFFKNKGYCAICDKGRKDTVGHIGKVSSRYGRVEGAEEEDKKHREEAKKKAAEQKKKNEEAKRIEKERRAEANRKAAEEQRRHKEERSAAEKERKLQEVISDEERTAASEVNRQAKKEQDHQRALEKNQKRG